MKKADLVKLLEIYNGDVQGFCTKGFWRKTFDSTTKGIAALQSFVNTELKDKSSEEPISGAPLLKLLDLIDARARRIAGTSRSYENQEGKATNQVFEKIYQYLWMDITLQEPRGYSAPGLSSPSLLSPGVSTPSVSSPADVFEDSSQAAASYEKFLRSELESADLQGGEEAFKVCLVRAASAPQEKDEKKAAKEIARIKKSLFLREQQKLTVKLLHSPEKCIGHCIAVAAQTGAVLILPGEQVQTHAREIDRRLAEHRAMGNNVVVKNIRLDKQLATCICVYDLFASEQITDVEIIPFRIRMLADTNIKEAGINMLEASAERGSKKASLLLARYYAGKDEELHNASPDRVKVVYYLEKARDKGSQEAQQILEKGDLEGFCLTSSPGLRG